MSIVAIVTGLFVGIFALLAIIMLLDMIGWVTIRDPQQRKWLFRSLIGSVVLAVAGFGTAMFREMEAKAPGGVLTAGATDPPLRGPKQVQPPSDPPPKQVAPPAGSTGPETLPAAVPEAVPAELQTWAAENLGDRPDLSPRFERDYPVCVAELRERTASEGVLTDADACARQLREHRRLYVVPLFAERERYADALLTQQRMLTRRQLGPEAQQRLNYLQREDRNFYYDDGAANLRFLRAGHRSREDLRLCETNDCRTAS